MRRGFSQFIKKNNNSKDNKNKETDSMKRVSDSRALTNPSR